MELELPPPEAEAEAEADAEDSSEAAPKPDRPTTKLTVQPVIVKGGKRHFFPSGQRLPQFSKSKIEDFATQNSKAGSFQVAEVKPASFFKPPKNAKPRFAEVADADAESEEETEVSEEGEEEEEVIAADSIELSPLPSVASLPDSESDEALQATADATTEAQLAAQDSDLSASLSSENNDVAAKSFIRSMLARKA